jgi:hypothetical protein
MDHHRLPGLHGACKPLTRALGCSQRSRLMAGTRLLAARGLAPPALGRAAAQRGLCARVVAKAEGGGKGNKSKGKKEEGGE